jgi:hypothetical protein
VLHGSAIEWGGQCVVFMGVSGVGKSTLASAFHKRGHSVLTDDLCVVRPGTDGKMVAHPGFPQTKLWMDSLKQLDISAESLRRIRTKLEKRAVSLGEQFAKQPLAVKKLYVLRPHNKEEFILTPLQGPKKFAGRVADSFRPPFREPPSRFLRAHSLLGSIRRGQTLHIALDDDQFQQRAPPADGADAAVHAQETLCHLSSRIVPAPATVCPRRIPGSPPTPITVGDLPGVQEAGICELPYSTSLASRF